MNFTITEKGVLEIRGARIVFRNFRGEGSKYNREGDRNFAIVIPDREIADDLVNLGWNVKIKPPRDEEDTPFMFLPVKIKFRESTRTVRNRNGEWIQETEITPFAWLIAGGPKRRLYEENIECLDYVDIANVDVNVRPYDWDVNGKTGRTAYLQSIEVTQEIDSIAVRYADEEYPEE